MVLEDILNTHQRPKMEVYGDYLYIVFKMLYLNGAHHEGGPEAPGGGENTSGNGAGEIVAEQVQPDPDRQHRHLVSGETRAMFF